jgi:hypothetical protein
VIVAIAWDHLTLAAAFVVGFLAGVITVLRLIRVVGTVIRRERDRDD